jgi:hypothetical protein
MKVGGCPFIYQTPSSRWTKTLMNGLELQTRIANTRKRKGKNEGGTPSKGGKKQRENRMSELPGASDGYCQIK